MTGSTHEVKLWCPGCQSVKPESAFGHRQRGHARRCLECVGAGREPSRDLRWCESCLKWKAVEEFTGALRRSRRPCKACLRARAAERAAVHANRSAVPCPSGRPRCGVSGCIQEGKFSLTDGTRACARHLKERVKERKGQ